MHDQKMGATLGAAVGAGGLPGAAKTQLRGHWALEARDADGNLKWTEIIDNIVVNAGLDYLLDVALSAGTPVTSWYIGLTGATPTVAAGNTMASHAGWTEVVAYSEASRQAFTDAGVTSQTCTNTASPAVFTINANSTDIGGAFLASDNTKSGTAGTLYAAGAFTAGNKSLDNGDTLTVTFTATASAS